ncbi:MAG TPA: S41 family peptidase [Patescibacteria group bacterium]|jgi:carboxyl-terminal processing protease|nr:S41 family peptidase [Patescibacteria group bacterium]
MIKFDWDKQAKKILTWPVVVVLLIAFLGIGYAFGQGHTVVSGKAVEINKGNQPQTADYSLLWDTLNLLNTKYVDRPLDQQKLLYGAVSGLVSAVGDPYTVFFNPDDAKKFSEELKGSFDGIGAEIGMKDNQLVIVAPLEGSPAEKAGLMSGDAILAINGEATSGLSVDQAVSKIRGKAGTEVTLTIVHKGKQEPIEIKITRARIEVKSVKFDTKDVNGKKIGVIKLSRFGEDTKGLMDHAIDTILSGNYKGIILDLRNDPGGFLETSIEIGSDWIDNNKTVVKEVNYKGEVRDYPAVGLARLKGIKTIVLVNGGSASAAEILAGALQDYKLATLVGEKTYGKGSVQELNNLKGDASIKITTAKWRTPKGRDIDKNGLQPDIKVEMTPADMQAQKDPQMDKALELVK